MNFIEALRKAVNKKSVWHYPGMKNVMVMGAI